MRIRTKKDNSKVVSANRHGIVVRKNGKSSFYKYEQWKPKAGNQMFYQLKKEGLVQHQQQSKRSTDVEVTVDKLELNNVQRQMYRRLMYGLDNYSKQERAEMSTDVLVKIIRNYQKAQKILHVMKAKVFYAAETKLFNAIFTDENQQVKDRDADWMLPIPKEATLNKLGITPKMIIDEFIKRKLLPKNFYELKPVI